MKKAIGTITTEKGEMTLFYNGNKKNITGEKEDLVEEIECAPSSLKDARKSVKELYGGWKDWNFKTIN